MLLYTDLALVEWPDDNALGGPRLLGRIADPDLVAVLARIIRRVKASDGKVPLLQRYDPYERLFGPPLPHLFHPRRHAIRCCAFPMVRRPEIPVTPSTPRR